MSSAAFNIGKKTSGNRPLIPRDGCVPKANGCTIRPMSNPANRFLEPGLSASPGRETSPSSPAEPSSTVVSRETETTLPSRYVLPKDLDAAIGRLDDQELERLASAVLEERARRKKPRMPEENQLGRNAAAVPACLPPGKINAIKAAFKAGVTPTRIAREFGLSRSDVQRALARDAKTR
jgi:hypothetical protein